MTEKIMSFDIETPGLDPAVGPPVSMQWEYKGEKPQYSEDLSGKVLDDLRDPNVKVIIQNVAFEWDWISYHFGIEITNYEDTMALSFIIDRGVPFAYTGISKADNFAKLSSVGLKKMAAHYLGADVWEDELIERLGTKKKDPGIARLVRCLFLNKEAPLKEIFYGKSKVLKERGFTDDAVGRAKLYELFKSYSIKDPHITMGIWEQIKEHADNKAYRNLMRGVPHMVKMRRRGVLSNKRMIEQISADCLADEKRAEAEIFRLVGKEFNIKSNDELPEILTSRGIVLPKTKRGLSTAKAVLEGLTDPIAKLIVEYRSACKMRATYVEGLLLEMDVQNLIHPKYNVFGTVHGRYSSKGEI